MSKVTFCRECRKDTSTANGCDQGTVVIKGNSYVRVTYGAEVSFKWNLGDRGDRLRCPDCNVTLGNLHHPGCGVEECPRCRSGFVGCMCRDFVERNED